MLELADETNLQRKMAHTMQLILVHVCINADRIKAIVTLSFA